MHLDRLADAAAHTAKTIRQNYPTLEIPFHSRWRHFDVGNLDRAAALSTHGLDDAELARARIDLVVVSVLLDAGAGEQWRYLETHTSEEWARSEGLAVASFRMFEAGAFSSQTAQPLLADIEGLSQFTSARLAAGFQVNETNPLLGLDGRAALIRALGRCVASNPRLFPGSPVRVGNLFDYLTDQAEGGVLRASAVLQAVLEGFGDVWPGRIFLDGFNLGDTWRHPALRYDDSTDGLLPIHKLSQWLTYSLIEPLEQAGLTISGIDELTGLAEYRNGGLFVDSGVLVPRDARTLTEPQAVDSHTVIEWRALTIALLDRMAPLVWKLLDVASPPPLVCLLEGGSWSAGRNLAQTLRPSGGPPITVISDGTVF